MNSSTDSTFTAPALFTMELARKYADKIYAKYPDITVCVFGDVARAGSGNALDLFIEVLGGQFMSYQGMCKDLGMHWIDKELVRADPRLQGRPPMLVRSEEALRVIDTGKGRVLHALDIAIDIGRPAGAISVICLPAHFRNYLKLRYRLQADLPKGYEENFIEKLAKEAIELE